MTETTSAPADWACVARGKWQHYADSVRDSDNAVAASIHEHSLAKMVPHLADAIDAAPREALRRLSIAVEHARMDSWRARIVADEKSDAADAHAMKERVAAFEWVLQRINEEMERAR